MVRFFVIIIILLSVIACSQSPEEKAIMDYEQSIDGTKTDLSMKIESLIQIGSLTCDDSAKILSKTLEEQAALGIERADKKFIEYHDKIREQIDILASTRNKARTDQAQKMIDMYLKFIKADSIRRVRFEQKDYEHTHLQNIYRKMKRFESTPDSSLASKFDCRYTIKNPSLNFAEQEIRKTYFITPDGKISHALKSAEGN